ncbi:flagellar protein FliT [Clostridium botulinum]|nr:flagellar protein FliT [Clostridium botulinum]
MDLENLIKEYKIISLEIKDALDNDNLDALDILLDQRQKIIDTLDTTNFNIEKLKEAYKKYEIFELDKLIFEQMNSQKIQLRKKIFEVEKGKKVTRGYNDINTKAVFLTKEI